MRFTLKLIIIVFIANFVFDLITFFHNPVFRGAQFHLVAMDALIIWLSINLLTKYKYVTIWRNKKCPNCNGVGKVLGGKGLFNTCSYCEGTGKIPKKRNGELDLVTKKVTL